MPGKLRRTIGALCAALVLIVMMGAVPVEASDGPIDPPSNAAPRSGADFVYTAQGARQVVSGFISPDPLNVQDGYPDKDYDHTGWTAKSTSAGTFVGTTSDGRTLLAYCIDLLTSTHTGLSYKFDSWDAGNVPNTGYVAQILNNYYPHNPDEPSGTDGEKAAAVQAAIWFFTDNYVLDPNSPLFDTTAQIVQETLDRGPAPEPEEPNLSITGPSEAEAGTVAGPFTVNTTASEARLTITGGEMFADAEGEQPIASGSTLPAGSTFYVRSQDPSQVRIEAHATVTAPSGNVALYVPDNPDDPDPATAQKLILANEVNLEADADKEITFTEPSPTPTPTTPTPTVTPTETPTPTTTPTHSPTPSRTPTHEPSPTRTAAPAPHPPKGNLPFTGAKIALPLLGGAALLIIGASVVVAIRRRARS